MKQSSPIIIRVDGSHQRGLGHIFRMRELATSMVRRGHKVKFVSEGDPTANALLESSGIPCVFFEGAEEATWRDLGADGASLFVRDVLDGEDMLLRALRTAFPVPLVCIDDAAAGLLWADAVINPLAFLQVDEGRPWRARRYDGPAYMLMAPRVVDLMGTATFRAQVSRVLIAFGGTDTHGLTARVLHTLATLPASGVTLRVNLGPGTREDGTLLDALQTCAHHHVTVVRAASLPDEIVAADLLVCAGGVMLYEAAALGVPAVSVPAEPHELLNAQFVAKSGAALVAGSRMEFDAAAIADAVRLLLPSARLRAQMAAAGPKLVDGRGLSRVVSILEGFLNSA